MSRELLLLLLLLLPAVAHPGTYSGNSALWHVPHHTGVAVNAVSDGPLLLHVCLSVGCSRCLTPCALSTAATRSRRQVSEVPVACPVQEGTMRGTSPSPTPLDPPRNLPWPTGDCYIVSSGLLSMDEEDFYAVSVRLVGQTWGCRLGFAPGTGF